MKKIPTLFIRNPENMKYVLPEVNPGCEWVIEGEGVATRKYDGVCTRLTEDGRWWFRREVKPDKDLPLSFVLEQVDEVTGKIVGWEYAENSGFKRWLDDALSHGVSGYFPIINTFDPTPPPGTYELVGPKINKNPEGVPDWHVLVAHGYTAAFDRQTLDECPRTFEDLRKFMQTLRWEGIVWHHPDGRMVKLKRRDFPQ
jgi:hypothetical protein